MPPRSRKKRPFVLSGEPVGVTLSADSSLYLSGLGRMGIHPGLETVRSVLEILGNPQRAYLTIQVVGTNGKGSTSSFIEAVLRAAGYRTGRFTSPHLVDIRERIALFGESISPDLFENILVELRVCLESHRLTLTFFEFLTVMAFMAFARSSCQIAVLEAGIGGRWDATTACDPVVTVLTGIALDHELILGKGIANIFEEKVAVGRSGRPFIASLGEEALRERFLERSREHHFIPVLDRRDFFGEWIEPDHPFGGLRTLEYKGRWGTRLVSSSMTATYQRSNLSSALAALEWTNLPLTPWALDQGTRLAKNPGRLDTVSRNPMILLDGAHNVSAVSALAGALSDRFPTPWKFGFFLGIHSDKEWKGMLSILQHRASAFFFPSDPGGGGIISSQWITPEEMRDEILQSTNPDFSGMIRAGDLKTLWSEAMDWANAGKDHVLVVTGSLYLVGAIYSDLRPGETSPFFSSNERDLTGPDRP